LFSDPLPAEPIDPSDPGATSIVGLPNVGSLVSAADGRTGELLPLRRKGDCECPGDTCQVLGACGGGVSDSDPPEAERIRVGGVPMANCTAGGEIELMSLLTLLLR